ncbi:MAG TPA: hypothetical protein VHY84_17405 [Bryobacteraceae bacterium]|jgi:hypothetical protein|nr:hypothetical protein [Bryobacteraceae bacterium]
MKLKAFFALAVEISFAGILAVAQTAAPAGQPSNGPAATPAPKPSAAAKPAVKKPPSQVDSVIQLVKGGMSEPFVIKYLQKNNKPTDLTPDDMVKLKAAGVSETVIGVMMDPTSAPAVTPAPQAEAPPAVPEPVPVATNSPAPVAPIPESSISVQGEWKGTLVLPKSQQPIVYHLGPGGTGTLDQPRAFLLGIPLQYSVTGGQISIVFPTAAATYTATVEGNQMSGTVSQNGSNYPLTVTLSGPVEDPSVNWKNVLTAKILENCPLTLGKGDQADIEIVTPGAVLALKKSGFVMHSRGTKVNPNDYKNGNIYITQAVKSSLARTNREGSTRTFVKGEKFWLIGIEVKDEGVFLLFLSDPIHETRYLGLLRFLFAQGTRPTPEEFLPVFSEVLDVVSTPPAAAPPAALPPVAPPPPLPASVDLGQTREQVVSALGQPEKIANVGANKQIYFFKNLKVTFVDGKVTDIE